MQFFFQFNYCTYSSFLSFFSFSRCILLLCLNFSCTFHGPFLSFLPLSVPPSPALSLLFIRSPPSSPSSPPCPIKHSSCNLTVATGSSSGQEAHRRLCLGNFKAIPMGENLRFQV